MNNTVILIPAYQPDDKLNTYVDELVASGAKKIIVVDDGGGEKYSAFFENAKKHPECTILTHKVNRGKGAALKTGLSYYNDNGLYSTFKGIITADSDGQHTTSDVISMAKALNDPEASNCLILGERSFDTDNVPFKSKAGNDITRFVFRLLYGLKIHDTQTGLRGIPNSLIPEFMMLDGDRYEYEMNMLMACSSKKIPIKSVPIKTIYIDENASTHFNALTDSFKIYRLLLGNFFKFLFSSLGSTVVDLGLFQVFVLLLEGTTDSYIYLATAISRTASSIVNFLLNKKLVFNHSGSLILSAIKYYALVISKMFASAFLVSQASKRLPIPVLPIKIIVDSVLFFVSYHVQKSAIFNEKSTEE